MKKQNLAAAFAALGLLAVAAPSNAAIIVSSAVVNQLYVATGQSIIVDFDGPNALDVAYTGGTIKTYPVLPTTITDSAPPPFVSDGTGPNAVTVCCAGGANYTADPTKYGSVQGSQTSSLSILSGKYLTSFSFYMGSPDTYNHVVFNLLGGGSQTFDGNAIWGGNGIVGDGDRSKGFRVYYDFQGAKVTSMDFSSGSNAFEFDGLAGTVVPEPATWAMMILGFGFAGGMIRRRKALTA